jgi:hypothetical protein
LLAELKLVEQRLESVERLTEDMEQKATSMLLFHKANQVSAKAVNS